MNLGRKAPPLPPKRASARVQARVNSPAATALIDKSRLSIAGLDAAKGASESALLEDKQVHRKKTNFRPTTNTALPRTRVSSRIQARAASTAANKTSDKSNLSIDGCLAAKEGMESAFLKDKQVHKKTNFRPTTNTAAVPPSRVSARIQARAAANETSDESNLSIDGRHAAKEGRESALLGMESAFLKDKQVHKKTNFRPTTNTAAVPPSRVSARIQERAAANETSDESNLLMRYTYVG